MSIKGCGHDLSHEYIIHGKCHINGKTWVHVLPQLHLAEVRCAECQQVISLLKLNGYTEDCAELYQAQKRVQNSG